MHMLLHIHDAATNAARGITNHGENPCFPYEQKGILIALHLPDVVFAGVEVNLPIVAFVSFSVVLLYHAVPPMLELCAGLAHGPC